MTPLDIIKLQTQLEQNRAHLAYDYVCSIPADELRKNLREVEALMQIYKDMDDWTKNQWQEYEILSYLFVEILAQINDKNRRMKK